MDFMKGIACHISKSSWDLQYLETGGTGGSCSPTPPSPHTPLLLLIFASFYFWWIEKNSVKVKSSTNYKTSWNTSKFSDAVYSITDLGTRDESCQ